MSLIPINNAVFYVSYRLVNAYLVIDIGVNDGFIKLKNIFELFYFIL